VLQDVEPRREDLERLYISAHTLSGTSASYGFPRFSEVAGKLAHVFQLRIERASRQRSARSVDGISFGWNFAARNRSPGNQRPGKESVDDIAVLRSATASRFRRNRRHSIFPSRNHVSDSPRRSSMSPSSLQRRALTLMRCHWTTRCGRDPRVFPTGSGGASPGCQRLPYFAGRQQQSGRDHKTVSRHSHGKRFGGASRLKRLGAIAHRVEDLIGGLRDGLIEPSPAVVDCVLSQWTL